MLVHADLVFKEAQRDPSSCLVNNSDVRCRLSRYAFAAHACAGWRDKERDFDAAMRHRHAWVLCMQSNLQLIDAR